jgi:16S rRNA (guanine527-N7)-methyltransferase
MDLGPENRTAPITGESDILSLGARELCQNDRDIDALITPRRDAILSLLNRYIAEIELFNPAYGLVGTACRRELVIRHILDALAPLGILYRLLQSRADTTPEAADVGSGAGLPGIPLAIALPEIHFTLIERAGRRAGFLRNTQAALGLGNVSVEETGMEQAAAGRFSLTVFRAFRPLEPKILKGLFRLCAPGGNLAAYKGRCVTIEAEMAALGTLAGGWEAIPCPVPMLAEERHLLLVRT